MSPSDEVSKGPSSGVFKTIRLALFAFGFLACVVVVMIPIYLLNSVINVQSQQLEQLEQLEQRLRTAEMKNADSVSGVQLDDYLSKMRTQLDDFGGVQVVLSDKIGQTERRLDTLSQQNLSSSDSVPAEQIKQLQTRQAQLEQALQAVEKRLTPAASDQHVSGKSPKPAVTVQTQRATRQTVSAKTLPFQLSAIEYRGGRVFAALMPSEASQLTQIQLLEVGQQYQGWTLTQIRTDNVHLKRQGRVVTLRLP
ncbi:hypothetical protein [Providencia rettgeri]|uniref:hypothetical protein n=1 Tax=Providencia rettgeri TaxID=587 RepID=UPI0024AC0B54